MLYPAGESINICELNIDGTWVVLNNPEPILTATNRIVLNPNVYDAFLNSVEISSLVPICTSAPQFSPGTQCETHMLGALYGFKSKVEAFRVCDGNGVLVGEGNLVDTNGNY